MENKEQLQVIEETFKKWLHVEDPYYLRTLLATKISHQLDGDPIWLMIIGPSSDGKSEYLRALTQEGEITVDDLTPKTFISGMKESLREQPQLAERLRNKIWYIYDMSIMMSKRVEDRSQILSDMRMIYDGKITKEFGTGRRDEIDVGNNTLICGSTPEIDNTILEDALLGTRFITYRIQTKNRFAVMNAIDTNEDQTDFMREKLNFAVKEFMQTMTIKPYTLTELENQNIQLLANTTTLLRATVSLDKSGEPRNIIYPEGPGRVYRQLKKLYKSYRIIGLDEEESLQCIRKICRDNINPVRLRLLEFLNHNGKKDEWGNSEPRNTSQIHVGTGLGKKTVKSHMHALNMMGIVDFKIINDGYRDIDQWFLEDSNLSLILDGKRKFNVGHTLRKYSQDGIIRP
jgi:hypothetical protein